jgi:hypothetical protein
MRLFALLSILLASDGAYGQSAAISRPTASPAPAAISPDELFSRRALRRARLLIQMRMMELRDAQLECVREALLRRLPDALWPEVPSPTRGSPDVAAAASRCSELLRF